MAAIPPQIPFGTDRADGGVYGGTATPDGASTISPAPLIFEEMEDSPVFNLGEQATAVKRFKVDWTQAQQLLAQYGRGQIYDDSAGRQWRILSIDLTYQAGDYAIVAITSEGINIYIPMPEYTIEQYQINPPAQFHPRCAPLNQTFGSMNGSTFVPGTFSPIAWVDLAVQQLTSGDGSDSQLALIQLQKLTNFITAAYPNGDLIAQESALELLKKKRRGEDNFYLAGYTVTFSRFFPFQVPAGTNAPDLDMGGRIELPYDNTSQVVLPPEYWTDSLGNNIYTYLAATLTPQFYANGVSWLRQADYLDYQRTWFRRTSTWLMGPSGGPITLTSNDSSQTTTYQWIGQWDMQWYTPFPTSSPNYPKFDF